MKLGYKDLDKLYIDGHLKLLDIRETSSGGKIYYFDIAGEKYVYKDSTYEYNELFACECAKELGLTYVDYFLAIYNKKNGVISRNYKKENASYISGYEILKKFYMENYDYFEEMGLPKKFEGIHSYANDDAEIKENLDISLVSNNLETIWLALEYYFKGYDVSHIMSQIVDLFIFSFLCNDFDKHAFNWEVEEYNGKINLAPIFDNERSFVYADEPLALHVSINDFEKTPYDVILKEFLLKSSKEYVDRFIEMYNTIYADDKFDELINRIEDKTGYRMPHLRYEGLERSYYSIKMSIENVLNEISCHKSIN